MVFTNQIERLACGLAGIDPRVCISGQRRVPRVQIGEDAFAGCGRGLLDLIFKEF